jgi:hypothetical protein
VGLPELPTDEVPPGGFRLVACPCEDADIEVHVEEKFLGADWVHDGNLIFNVEGYGRFRLWFKIGE